MVVFNDGINDNNWLIENIVNIIIYTLSRMLYYTFWYIRNNGIHYHNIVAYHLLTARFSQPYRAKLFSEVKVHQSLIIT